MDELHIRYEREATSLQEFLEFPLIYNPKHDLLTGMFEDETLLTHCVRTQNVNAVYSLLSLHVDPNGCNDRGVFPLTIAAHKGNVVIMKMLINAGAQVNTINMSGSTALIQASHFGHCDAVRVLLANNASSNIANYKGTTALMRAAQEGHFDISDCLLTSKLTEVNRKNLEGMSALMLASQRGHARIVQLLIKHGAQMDEQTMQGSTALMLACKRGHMQSVEVLVAMGAEIFMRDKQNRTARDIARKRNHEHLFVWLDTQVQIAKIQQSRNHFIADLVRNMRKSYLSGKLQMNQVDSSICYMVKAVAHRMAAETPPRVGGRLQQQPFARASSSPSSSLVLTSDASESAAAAADAMSLLDEALVESIGREFFPATAVSKISNIATSSLTITAKSPHTADSAVAKIVHVLRGDLKRDLWTSAIIAQERFVGSSTGLLSARITGYMDWMWPLLLQRCFSMPRGVFEIIMDFLPLPRLWDWTLYRLKTRCRLSVYQTLVDTSILIDEIFTDMCLFSGHENQRNSLMKINQSPLIHPILLDVFEMPRSLLNAVRGGAAFQSLLMRYGEIPEQPLQISHAREFMQLAADLVAWDKSRKNALKVLNLRVVSSGGAVVGGRGGAAKRVLGRPMGTRLAAATAAAVVGTGIATASPLRSINDCGGGAETLVDATGFALEETEERDSSSSQEEEDTFGGHHVTGKRGRDLRHRGRGFNESDGLDVAAYADYFAFSKEYVEAAAAAADSAVGSPMMPLNDDSDDGGDAH